VVLKAVLIGILALSGISWTHAQRLFIEKKGVMVGMGGSFGSGSHHSEVSSGYFSISFDDKSEFVFSGGRVDTKDHATGVYTAEAYIYGRARNLRISIGFGVGKNSNKEDFSSTFVATTGGISYFFGNLNQFVVAPTASGGFIVPMGNGNGKPAGAGYFGVSLGRNPFLISGGVSVSKGATVVSFGLSILVY
jgi:hypothetical protein